MLSMHCTHVLLVVLHRIRVVCAAQCASVVHCSQVPAGMQYGVVPLQCESDPHSAQILVVGLQWGFIPPPSVEH